MRFPGKTLKERKEEMPTLYVEAYEVITAINIAKEYADKGLSGKDLIEPLEEYVMNLNGYTEKDIIMFYDKDFLMACREEWEEESK